MTCPRPRDEQGQGCWDSSRSRVGRDTQEAPGIGHRVEWGCQEESRRIRHPFHFLIPQPDLLGIGFPSRSLPVPIPRLPQAPIALAAKTRPRFPEAQKQTGKTQQVHIIISFIQLQSRNDHMENIPGRLGKTLRFFSPGSLLYIFLVF